MTAIDPSGRSEPQPHDALELVAAPGETTAGEVDRSGAGAGSGAAGIWARLASLLTSGPAPTEGSLAVAEAQRSVYFVDGRFSVGSNRVPQTLAGSGRGLFAAANLIDDTPGNLFDRYAFTAENHSALLANLKTDLAQVAAGVGGLDPQFVDGLSAKQLLQIRSCAATVLLDLITAESVDEAVKLEGFGLYRDMLEAEAHPVLIDNMALHLDRLRERLPAGVQSGIDALVAKLAPTKPPYEAWFADGNERVRVRWASGDHSIEGNRGALEKEGFTLVSEGNPLRRLVGRAEQVWEKTYEVDGIKTTFEVHLRVFSTDMFDDMDDPDVDISIYTGHSSWGRNVRNSLARGPEATGESKLVLNELCVGKGELQMMAEAFPEADIVTTFNSAYPSEGRAMVFGSFDGIAKRQDYTAIAEGVRKRNPFSGSHRRQGIDNNFIFPNAVAERRKVLDQDHDGQADIFDRVVNFDSFAVAEDTRWEFQAKAPGRPVDVLVGTKVHFAAQTVNRLCLFNEEYEHKNTQGEVLPGGFFEPQPGETALFRFGEVEIGGVGHLVLTMNSHYSHMSEEAVRMAATFEYTRFKSDGASSEHRSRETVANGLLMASHSLHTDSSSRDNAVWGRFLEGYGFPQLPRTVFESAKDDEHHFYAGSDKAIDRVLDKLSEADKTALVADSAGTFRNVG